MEGKGKGDQEGKERGMGKIRGVEKGGKGKKYGMGGQNRVWKRRRGRVKPFSQFPDQISSCNWHQDYL